MTYTVEVRVDSYSGNTITEVLTPHAFLVITGADGVEHSYGFAPTETGFFGPGNVSDNADRPYDASSGQLQITEVQYTALMDYITRTDANPPPYALLYGSQCSSWLLAGLAEAGIIPSVLGPSMEPTNLFVDFFQTLIFNPIWEKLGFEINDLSTSARSCSQPFAISTRTAIAYSTPMMPSSPTCHSTASTTHNFADGAGAAGDAREEMVRNLWVAARYL